MRVSVMYPEVTVVMTLTEARKIINYIGPRPCDSATSPLFDALIEKLGRHG